MCPLIDLLALHGFSLGEPVLGIWNKRKPGYLSAGPCFMERRFNLVFILSLQQLGQPDRPPWCDKP